MKKRNAIVGQSGGPTAVINASLSGVIQKCLSPDNPIEKIYGMIHGIEGFLNDWYMDLGAELSPEDRMRLRLTPADISCPKIGTMPSILYSLQNLLN